MNSFSKNHPNLSLVFSGALAVASLPPINILPLVFLSLAFLIHQLTNTQSAKQAFARGFFWGLGYFAVGLCWINVALTVDWPRFAWLMPLATLGLPALIAAYIGLATAATYVAANFTRTPRAVIILLFPIFWTVFEILRGTALSGFPWNVIGGAFTEFSPLFQIASVFGIYGAGFIICAATALFIAAYEIQTYKYALRAASISILIAVAAFGFIRLNLPPEPARQMNIRIIQPNVAQSQKWTPENRSLRMRNLLTETASPADLFPDLVVWPEASAPYILAEMPPAREAIKDNLPRGAELAVGSIRRNPQGQFFNSMEFLNSNGEITAHYHKFHLVPFGEYVPFGKYIPLPVVADFSGLGRGAGPQTTTIAGIKVSPLICYEAIFPGEVTDLNHPPQLLLNVTDDGWFGNTIGPHQHLAQARARAVEEGLPMVRAANTGISAIVDRYGRVNAALPYGEFGHLDGTANITTTPSPPAAHGRGYLWLGLLAAAYMVFVIRMTFR